MARKTCNHSNEINNDNNNNKRKGGKKGKKKQNFTNCKADEVVTAI
jgi:hypothetical protein